MKLVIYDDDGKPHFERVINAPEPTAFRGKVMTVDDGKNRFHCMIDLDIRWQTVAERPANPNNMIYGREIG